MKKILKLLVLVLVVTVVAVGVLAACKEEPVPLGGAPVVTQQSNKVFTWENVQGAEHYVVSIDDGAPMQITVNPAQVSEYGSGEVQYTVNRYVLDDSTLAAGKHTVKFAAVQGTQTTAYSAVFEVVVGGGVVAAPSFTISGDEVSLSTDALEVEFTFTTNNSPVTVTWTKSMDDPEFQRIALADLLGTTALEDGAVYTVTAVAKSGDAVSQPTATQMYVHNAQTTYAKPAIVVDNQGFPTIELNNDVNAGEEVIITIDFGGEYTTVPVIIQTSGGSVVDVINLVDIEGFTQKMLASIGQTVEISARVDYTSEGLGASEWADKVSVTMPSVPIADVVDEFISVNTASEIGKITVTNSGAAVGVAVTSVSYAGQALDGVAGGDDITVYAYDPVMGANAVEVVVTFGETTYTIEREVVLPETVEEFFEGGIEAYDDDGEINVVNNFFNASFAENIVIEVTVNGTPVTANTVSGAYSLYNYEYIEGVNEIVVTASYNGETATLLDKLTRVDLTVNSVSTTYSGDTITWTAAADATGYVVSVLNMNTGIENEFEVDSTSFDFNLVEQGSDTTQYSIYVYGVKGDLRATTGTELVVYRMGAPTSVVHGDPYQFEIRNYSDVHNLIYITYSDDTFLEQYSIGNNESETHRRSTFMPSDELTIKAYYQGDGEYMMNSLPVTYTFKYVDELAYRIVDGDKIELLGGYSFGGVDENSGYNYYISTASSTASGVTHISSEYVTDGMFEILDYIDKNNITAPTYYIYPEDNGNYSDTGVNELVKYVTVRAGAGNREEAPRFTKYSGQSNYVEWGDEFGTWEYEVIDEYDETLGSDVLYDSGTVSNYADKTGERYYFVNDPDGGSDLPAGEYTFRVRRVGSGDTFSSEYNDVTYVVFPTGISGAKVVSGADSSRLDIPEIEGVTSYSITSRYYRGSNFYDTTPETLSVGYDYSISTNTSYDYDRFVINANASGKLYNTLPTATIDVDRIYVNYINNNYDAIYYVKEGVSAAASWILPEVYTYGTGSSATTYICAFTVTEDSDSGSWTYTSTYSASSSNGTAILHIDTTNLAGGYMFTLDTDVVRNYYYGKVDYIVVDADKSVLEQLEILGLDTTSYGFYDENNNEITADFAMSEDPTLDSIYIKQRPAA